MDEDFVKYIRQLRTVNEEQVRRQHEQKLQEERAKTATQAECERLRKGYNLDWLSRLEDRTSQACFKQDKPNDLDSLTLNSKLTLEIWDLKHQDGWQRTGSILVARAKGLAGRMAQHCGLY
ncbi:MAG: hypothetical protein IPM84_12665 [Anaerolineae bacterium]|nr:hypothetical protein [Anaerolineae bacterium]